MDLNWSPAKIRLLFELRQNRLAKEGNRAYMIARAGTAAAHSKRPPKQLFREYRSVGDDDDGSINLAERRKRLLKEKRDAQGTVQVGWGDGPEDDEDDK